MRAKLNQGYPQSLRIFLSYSLNYIFELKPEITGPNLFPQIYTLKYKKQNTNKNQYKNIQKEFCLFPHFLFTFRQGERA